ncbi:DegT/DnrJ/EryC1/StrS family aminotransferase, partial [Campylobacter coli]
MNSDMLKQDILNKVKEYYKLYHANKQTQFIEGKTKINYAGRIFDEKEMENLVDSSLDFWLTAGKYTEQFEKNLANFLGVKWAFLVNSGSSANLLAFYALTSPLLKERQIKRG